MRAQDDDPGYSLQDLLEQAKDDESWETDKEIREQLVKELERALNYL